MTQIALVPIILAAVVTVLLSTLWYHPRFLGGPWMRLSGITPEQTERGKKHLWFFTIVAFLASMLVAYVMDYFGIIWGVTNWLSAAELGFLCWAGFAAPPMLGMVLWEQKPFRLYAIVSLYWLASFILIALVLLYTSALFVPNSSDPSGASAYPANQ